MSSKIIQSALNINQVFTKLLFLKRKWILNFKNMNWTVTSRITKNRLLFSFRGNSPNSIVKLHNVSAMTNNQNLLFNKWILLLKYVLSDYHLNEFMDSFVYINPTLPIFTFVLSYGLLLFLCLFLPARKWMSCQYTTMLLTY